MTEPPAQANALHVAALLRDQKESLIQTWIQRVLTDPKVPEAHRLSMPDLLDHIPRLIDRIVAALSGGGGQRTPEPPSPFGEAAGRTQGDSKEAWSHADHRFQERYSTEEAMRELSHFRAAVMDLCCQERVPLEGEAAKHVHALIDEGMGILATGMERAAHAELRRDALLRERFIGILGHDLRNPLATISMAAGMLLEWESLPAGMLRPVRRIASSADRMARLIRDLLDLTRSRVGGGLPIPPQPADLHAICQHTIDELELQHPTRTVLPHGSVLGRAGARAVHLQADRRGAPRLAGGDERPGEGHHLHGPPPERRAERREWPAIGRKKEGRGEKLNREAGRRGGESF